MIEQKLKDLQAGVLLRQERLEPISLNRIEVMETSLVGNEGIRLVPWQDLRARALFTFGAGFEGM